MEDESSCGVTAAPPPLLDDGFAAGVLVELVAFGLDGGDVLGAAEGLGEVVDVTACVGVGPVHDELGLTGTVFWPVPPGGAELVVPWLGDVEPDAGGDVFGLPLGLLVGWPLPLVLASGDALPLEPVVLPPFAVPLDEVTGGVTVPVVLRGVPVLVDVTGGLEDAGTQGFDVS